MLFTHIPSTRHCIASRPVLRSNVSSRCKIPLSPKHKSSFHPATQPKYHHETIARSELHKAPDYPPTQQFPRQTMLAQVILGMFSDAKALLTGIPPLLRDLHSPPFRSVFKQTVVVLIIVTMFLVFAMSLDKTCSLLLVFRR
jgi:hypothetical protein